LETRLLVGWSIFLQYPVSRELPLQWLGGSSERIGSFFLLSNWQLIIISFVFNCGHGLADWQISNLTSLFVSAA